MGLIKYILHCLVSVISLGLGAGGLDSSKYSTKEYIFMNILGVLILIVLISVFLLFAIKIFRNKRLNILWAFLCTVGVALIFCVICILIEWLIKLF